MSGQRKNGNGNTPAGYSPYPSQPSIMSPGELSDVWNEEQSPSQERSARRGDAQQQSELAGERLRTAAERLAEWQRQQQRLQQQPSASPSPMPYGQPGTSPRGGGGRGRGYPSPSRGVSTPSTRGGSPLYPRGGYTPSPQPPGPQGPFLSPYDQRGRGGGIYRGSPLGPGSSRGGSVGGGGSRPASASSGGSSQTSELTPKTSEEIERMRREAGFPTPRGGSNAARGASSGRGRGRGSG